MNKILSIQEPKHFTCDRCTTVFLTDEYVQLRLDYEIEYRPQGFLRFPKPVMIHKHGIEAECPKCGHFCTIMTHTSEEDL